MAIATKGSEEECRLGVEMWRVTMESVFLHERTGFRKARFIEIHLVHINQCWEFIWNKVWMDQDSPEHGRNRSGRPAFAFRRIGAWDRTATRDQGLDTHAYQDITTGHFQQTASALRSSCI